MTEDQIHIRRALILSGITLLAPIALFAYLESTQKRTRFEEIVVKKVVLAKAEQQKTDLKYKFNFWKGDFYHVPNIYTAYVLALSDGTTKQVDFAKYATTNVGDTITETEIIQVE